MTATGWGGQPEGVARPDIELVVTDLDGTLWDGDERIHQRTLAAMVELRRRGVPLLVATGRRRRSATYVLGREGLAPPAVLLDGSMGRYLDNGGGFHDAVFEPAAAAAVLGAFTDFGLQPCVYIDRPTTGAPSGMPAADVVEVLVGPQPSTHPRHLEIIAESAQAVTDLAQAVTTERVFAFGIIGGDPALLGRVAARFGDAADASVVADRILRGATLMVRPSGVSKWLGVQAYCRAHGLDPDRVLAVGDGENDVELLAAARVACVVSDGCDAALDLADHVLEPANTGGWSAILELL